MFLPQTSTCLRPTSWPWAMVQLLRLPPQPWLQSVQCEPCAPHQKHRQAGVWALGPLPANTPLCFEPSPPTDVVTRM